MALRSPPATPNNRRMVARASNTTRFVLSFALFTLFACDSGSSGPQLSAEAASYLNAALDTMEAHSVRRYEVDWGSLRLRTRKRADGADTPRDTYDAIRFALNELDDHSIGFRANGLPTTSATSAFPIFQGQDRRRSSLQMLSKGRLGVLIRAPFVDGSWIFEGTQEETCGR